MTSGICKSAALAVSTPEHLLSKVPTQAGLLFKKQAVKRHHHKHNLKHRYEFLQTLGKGTYGKVKKAIDRSGRAVAIKSIRKDKIKDELDLIHIRREIEIMSSLNHPNIISIYEVFENKDKIVIVMEYASKGDLYDYISERQRLTEQEARHFFRQIVSAVYYCHKNGIVHRDLKLENILLDANGNIKIADFGLSNLFQHDKYLQTFCGSPLYASPEIVNGRPYKGPEVDSWSLGVLLYTLVHGAMPFNGQDYKVLVNQISSGEYKEPTSSSDASGLIRWMLMVNPERRATIDDIANHWWVNWGYKTSICETESHLAGDSPLATIAEWLRRSSRPLFENGSKVRCFFKQHTSGSTLERQRSLKKSKKENDVSHTLQDTTDPKSALKRPKGILKKKSNYEPKPQSGNIPLVVEPKKDNTVLPPTSSAVSQTVYPPEGRNKMTDAKTPSAPKKGILKKPQLRESGYYSSLERSESQEMLDYDKDEVTDSIFENEDGPVTETSQRKGILKRNGKFSSSYKDAIDDAVGMTFGPLDEFTFNKSDLAPRRTHPSSAISDDSILSTESFDQLDLPKQVPCRRNMRGCISAENLLQFDENEMDYRPRLWSMQCYQSRIGDSTFSLTDFDNVTEVYKKAMQINVKLGCGLAR